MDLRARGAYQVCHHEHRRGNALSFRERQRIIVKIAVAVVKGDGRDRVFRSHRSHRCRAPASSRETNRKLRPSQSNCRSSIWQAHQHGWNRGRGAGAEILHHPVIANHQGTRPGASQETGGSIQASPAHRSRGPGFDPASNHANTFDSRRRANRRDARSNSAELRQIRPTRPGGYNSSLDSLRLSRLQCDL